MLKRNYMISGIDQGRAEVWYRGFKDYVKFYEDSRTGTYLMKIPLTIFEAIRVRIGLIGYNFGHKCNLKMSKCKGQRYRV